MLPPTSTFFCMLVVLPVCFICVADINAPSLRHRVGTIVASCVTSVQQIIFSPGIHLIYEAATPQTLQTLQSAQAAQSAQSARTPHRQLVDGAQNLPGQFAERSGSSAQTQLLGPDHGQVDGRELIEQRHVDRHRSIDSGCAC